MFKNTFQSGLLSIFYSCGSNPLAIWDMEVNNGHIKRLTDKEVNSIVLEIVSTNVATTYITCPPRHDQVLGITLPFLVMIIKNLKRYFSFEITILDDKHLRRRFRISNFQSTTKIKPFCTSMPIGLASGWNQIQFNLADFTRRAYGTNFLETLRVQVHANARLRRIYFCEKLYTEDELPQDYKLYMPLERKKKQAEKKPSKTETVPKMSKKSILIKPKEEAPAEAPAAEQKAEEKEAAPPSEAGAPSEEGGTPAPEGGEGAPAETEEPPGAEPSEPTSEPATEPTDEPVSEPAGEDTTAEAPPAEAPAEEEGAPAPAEEEG